MERAVGVGVAAASGALALGAAAWVAGGGADVGGVHWIASGVIALSAVAMIAAILKGSVYARVSLVAAALLGSDLVWAAEVAGYSPVHVRVLDHGVAGYVTAAAIAMTAYGLHRRKLWARWCAWAGGAAGILSNGLNGIATLADPTALTYVHAMVLACSGLLFAGLVGATVRAEFESSESSDAVWQTRDRLIAALRWTVILNLLSIMMLVVYAWTQPVVAQTQASAVVLTVVLGIGVVLTVRRNLGGALVLTLAGAGLLLQSGLTALWAETEHARVVTAYYLLFWIPAGLVSTATGVALVRRIASRAPASPER